jgi:hypothetical protein
MAGSSINWHKTSGVGVKARVYIPASTLRATGIDINTLSGSQLTTLASLIPQPSGQAKSAVDTATRVSGTDYQALAQSLQSMSGRLIGDANIMRYGTPDPNMISADSRSAWDTIDSFTPARRAKYDALVDQSRNLSQLASKAQQAKDALTPKSPAELAKIATAKTAYEQAVASPVPASLQSWAQSVFGAVDAGGTLTYSNADLIALRDSNIAQANGIVTTNPSANTYADAARAVNTARAIEAILAQRG